MHESTATEKLLAMPQLEEAARGALDVIARNARTLLKHVNDRLDVSKLEAGQMEPNYARTDLARLVRLVAGHFEALAQDKHFQCGPRSSRCRVPVNSAPMIWDRRDGLWCWWWKITAR